MRDVKRYQDVVQGRLMLYEINKPLEPSDEKKSPKELVSPEYHGILPLFGKVSTNKLPPHQPYDHRIALKEGLTPSYRPIYALSRHKHEELRQ